jgi:putative transposase
VEYCWFDPVKHGLVGAVRDGSLSSFHRDVRGGLVGEDWAGEGAEGRYGE